MSPATSKPFLLKVKLFIWPFYFFFAHKLYDDYLGWKEKKKGLDFSRHATVEELNLPHDVSYEYQASNTSSLKKTLSQFKITENDTILDYGCGKGKALYTMSKYPFKSIDGVELSKQLCEIAMSNIEILELKNVQIFNQNAATYKKIDTYNYFYFYNPFPGPILGSVVSNIEESIRQFPRKVTIIYNEPKHKDVFLKSNCFKAIKSKKYISIYTNQP